MVKKILVVKGESKFEVLRKAADEIATGFCEKGYEVTILDMKDPEQSKTATMNLLGDYSFIFSCQAVWFDVLCQDGVPLIGKLYKPYIGWIFDDCLYHEARVRNVRFDNSYLFTINESNIEDIRMMYPETKNLHYLPHGGFESAEGEVEKDIGVLVSGNLGKKPVFEEMFSDIMPVESFLAKECIEILHLTPGLGVRKALGKVLENIGEVMTSQLLRELNRVIHFVDKYVRYECRCNIITALLEAGIELHFIGEGCEWLGQKYPGLVVMHGGMDIEEVVSFMNRSKVIINPFCTYDRGMHERILTAMLNNAACFTPWNEYLEEEFGNRLEYINLSVLDKMTDRVKYVLDNYVVYKEEVLDDNKVLAKEQHTWKKRGEQIAEFYEREICKVR